MKASIGRAVALVSGGLMVAGLAATPASAQDFDRDRDRRGSCEVRAFERGGDLRVSIDGPRRADSARVVVRFDRGGSDSDRVNLRRGEGRTSFDIPRRADSALVTVRIDGRVCGRDFVDDLRDNRRF